MGMTYHEFDISFSFAICSNGTLHSQSHSPSPNASRRCHSLPVLETQTSGLESPIRLKTYEGFPGSSRGGQSIEVDGTCVFSPVCARSMRFLARQDLGTRPTKEACASTTSSYSSITHTKLDLLPLTVGSVDPLRMLPLFINFFKAPTNKRLSMNHPVSCRPPGRACPHCHVIVQPIALCSIAFAFLMTDPPASALNAIEEGIVSPSSLPGQHTFFSRAGKGGCCGSLLPVDLLLGPLADFQLH